MPPVERDIIELIGRTAAPPGALLDDAYLDEASRLIYTTDMLVEGRHFKLDYFSPEDLGWKAAAVNISDIASMGGQLQYLLISLGLPDALELEFIRRFYAGLREAAERFGGLIIGGDTVGSDTLVLNVTATGVLPPHHVPGRRTAAQPGDLVIGTGFHGLSEAGRQALESGLPGFEACKQAHLRPMPQVEAAARLATRYERYALMDSSDGLADAAIKIAEASGAQVILEQAKLPQHPELTDFCQKTGEDPLQLMLYGGEDFQLVATLPPDGLLPEGFTLIGRVEAGTSAAFLESEDKTCTALDLSKTYQHFHGEQHA